MPPLRTPIPAWTARSGSSGSKRPQHIRRLRGRHLYSLVAFPMVPWIVLLRQKGSLCRLPWNGRSFGWQWELVAGDSVGS